MRKETQEAAFDYSSHLPATRQTSVTTDSPLAVRCAEVLRPEGFRPDSGDAIDANPANPGNPEGESADSRPTRIVIGIAATTAGIDSATAEALPLVRSRKAGTWISPHACHTCHWHCSGPPRTQRNTTQQTTPAPQVAVMVPSLLSSVEQGAGRYTFHLYVGYDEGDPVFDNAATLAKLRRRLRTVVGSYPVGFRTVRFPSVGSPTAVWNGLFAMAVADGADYFLAVRTDTRTGGFAQLTTSIAC